MNGLKEILAKFKSGEVDEEQFGDELNKLLPLTHIPKQKYNETADRLHEMEKKYSELEATLSQTPDMQKQIKDMQDSYNKQLKEKDDAFNAYKKNSYIESFLKDSGVKTLKAVRGLIDEAKVECNENGEFSGLKDQIDSLKSDSATSYLFNVKDEDKPEFKDSSKGNRSCNDTELQAIRDAMGL